MVRRAGCCDGSFGFGGEESAGASFLRRDGRVHTTDKDGLILDLLAAEITAVTGRDPGQHYEDLRAKFGTPYYTRVDAPATPAEKDALKKLDPAAVKAATLAGDPIVAKLTRAPGNGAAIGGLKVASDNGWFAARPSGTENIYKIYAESLTSADHLADDPRRGPRHRQRLAGHGRQVAPRPARIRSAHPAAPRTRHPAPPHHSTRAPLGAPARLNIRGFKLGGRGVAAGCSSTRNGPPARRQPTRAIQVPGWTVAGATSVAAGVACHPEKCGPELRGSMHAGARRCFRKLSST